MLITWRHATLIVAGLTGILAMLPGGATAFNGSPLHLVLEPGLSSEACRSRDRYPYQVPSSPYTTIGRLAFESDHGWLFLRKSMVYNARVPGAAAVVLKSANTRREISFRQVPPQVDWVPDRGPAG